MEPARNPHDLIIGAAVGYRSSHVRIFAQSLLKTGYRGRTLLITGDLPDSEVQQMNAWGLDVLPVSQFPGRYSRRVGLKLMAPRSRFLRSRFAALRFAPFPSRMRTRLMARIGVHYHHIGCSRFSYYWDYLDQHPEVKRILLADVRDVFFQTDLFAEAWDRGLHVSLEDSRGCIGRGEYGITDATFDHPASNGHVQRGVNAYWIRKLFGEDMVERIADKPICCAGVTYGSRRPMMQYLATMVAEIARFTEPINEEAGFDQGVHNVMLHTGRFPGAVIHENGVGPIYTVHAIKEDEFPLNGSQRIVRQSGQLAALVHQYDRSPRLNAIFGA